MSEKRKIQRFNLDEGRIWEAIEGLSPFKTTYTLEEVCEKLNELAEENDQLHHELQQIKEYLQTKIDECKNHKKMKEKIVEQQKTIISLKEENEQLKKENRMLKKDLNKLYKLLMDKGISHNELQDVLWGIDDE